MITAQSLPPDVLCEIFKFFPHPLLIFSDGRVAGFPWYLGHICSSWRAVFLSMKQEFWSVFMLYGCSNYWDSRTSRWERCVDMAETFLEFNQGQPFSFKIDKCLWSHPDYSVLYMLMEESTCWKDVSFSIEFSQIPDLITIKDHLPLLRSLDLDAEYGYSAPDTQPTDVPEDCQDIFKDAPHLAHVRLADLSTWQFTWSSLVSLELTQDVHDPQLLRVLPQMINLEKLMLGRGRTDGCNDSIMITLPRLKNLNVSDLVFLKILTTPALEQLVLNVGKCNRWKKMLSIWPSFIHRSSCQLNFFGATGCPTTHLAYALKDMPELKFLGLVTHLDGFTEIFELLACSPNKQPLVAELQTLRVSAFNEPHLPAFITFLDSRTINRPKSVHQIQEIIIVMSEEHNDMVKEVREQCSIRDIQPRFETRRSNDDMRWDAYRDSFYNYPTRYNRHADGDYNFEGYDMV